MRPTLNITLYAARSASELTLRFIGRLGVIPVNERGTKDYVTEVDRAVEQATVTALHKVYPTYAIMGEEDGFVGGSGKNTDYLQVVDPLDGITNFIHDVPHFAVDIACKYEGHLGHAVILDPVRQKEFATNRGHDAIPNGRRLCVSGRKSLGGALLDTSFPFRGNQIDNLDSCLNMFHSLVDQTAGVRHTDTASLSLACTAVDRYNTFWRFDLSEWDMMADALLIREAGGLISDFTGNHEPLEKNRITTDSTKCFEALLTTIQPHLPPSLKC